MTPAIEGDHLNTLQVFDAVDLVKLHCGERASGGDVVFHHQEGEIEAYGVEETAYLMESASKMPYIAEFGANLDSRLRLIVFLMLHSSVYVYV